MWRSRIHNLRWWSANVKHDGDLGVGCSEVHWMGNTLQPFLSHSGSVRWRDNAILVDQVQVCCTIWLKRVYGITESPWRKQTRQYAFDAEQMLLQFFEFSACDVSFRASRRRVRCCMYRCGCRVAWITVISNNTGERKSTRLLTVE